MTLHALPVYTRLLVLCRAGVLSTAIFFPLWASAQIWPTIKLPENIVVTPIGDQITQNGLPMHLQVFVTKESPDVLIAWFRDSFGRRRVEDKVGKSTVIGRVEGDFYLSVQITPTVNGSRGIVAVSRIKAIGEALARNESLVFNVPGDSKVVSDTQSKDGKKTARHVIYTNQHSQEMNRELVTAFLKEKGYKLEREAKVEDKPGHALFFRDGDREAIAVITSQGVRTAVVVNIMSYLK